MTWILFLILLAVECSVVTAQQRHPPVANAFINPTAQVGANRAGNGRFGNGNWGSGSMGNASWHTGARQFGNHSVGNRSAWNQSGWGLPANYGGNGFNWGYVSGGFVSAVPYWGGGCWNGVWGLGTPWLMPPAYVRNNDGAVFLPPTLGGYGYGFGYDGFGGYPGIWPGYGLGGSVWPNFGFAPSLVNLNMYYADLSFNPWIQSTATYSIVPKQRTVWSPPIDREPEVDSPTDFGWQLPDRMRVSPIPEVPLVTSDLAAEFLNDEFPAISRKEIVSSAGARLQSLRHQTAGDDAFRSGEYASAEVFYQTAIHEAPDRRAPWLRMAFVKIAQQEFDLAVSHLKTGLLLLPDKTRTWVRPEELYGSQAAVTSAEHLELLWNWVTEQPLSTDRLLLIGSFQQLRGINHAADDLLTMAAASSQMQAYVSSLRTIVADDERHYQSIQQAESRREDGIIMRGSRSVGSTTTQSSPIEDVPPVPVPPAVDSNESSFTTPVAPALESEEPAPETEFKPLVIPPVAIE